MRRTSVLCFRFCIAFDMRKWFNRFTNALKSLLIGDNTDMLVYDSNYHSRNIWYMNRLLWVSLWDYICRMKTKYMAFCIQKNDISMPIAKRKSKLQYFGLECVTSNIFKTIPNPHVVLNWNVLQQIYARPINYEYQKNKLSQIAYDMKSSAWLGKHITAFNNGKITTLNMFPKGLIDYVYPRLPKH